jgi:hypothetical protein
MLFPYSKKKKKKKRKFGNDFILLWGSKLKKVLNATIDI